MVFSPTRLVAAAVTSGALVLLAACQATPVQQAQGRGNMLVDAGFVARKADTPQRVALLKGLPPHRFVKQTVNGKVTYLFADPVACTCVYVGDPAAWQTYRNVLNAQQMISQPLLDSGLTPSGIDNLDGWGEF